MPLVKGVKKEYEGIQDELADVLEDKPVEDLPTIEEEEIITKGKAADLFKTPVVKEEKKTPEGKVSEKMEKITSEFKGQELLVKYEKYDKPFKVTMKDIKFLTSSIINDIETKEHPSAHGITSTGKEVSFHPSEIVNGPP